MAGGSVLAVAVKSGIGAIAMLLVGLGLVAAGLAAAALFRAAIDTGEARSRGDVRSQLRALDELASLGSLQPDEYAARRAALLRR